MRPDGRENTRMALTPEARDRQKSHCQPRRSAKRRRPPSDQRASGHLPASALNLCLLCRAPHPAARQPERGTGPRGTGRGEASNLEPQMHTDPHGWAGAGGFVTAGIPTTEPNVRSRADALVPVPSVCICVHLWLQFSCLLPRVPLLAASVPDPGAQVTSPYRLRHDTMIQGRTVQPPIPPAATRLDVDLGAVVANWRLLCQHHPSGPVAGVVKADAYGLGAADVAPALHAAGCRHFFVAVARRGAGHPRPHPRRNARRARRSAAWLRTGLCRARPHAGAEHARRSWTPGPRPPAASDARCRRCCTSTPACPAWGSTSANYRPCKPTTAAWPASTCAT